MSQSCRLNCGTQLRTHPERRVENDRATRRGNAADLMCHPSYTLPLAHKHTIEMREALLVLCSFRRLRGNLGVKRVYSVSLNT